MSFTGIFPEQRNSMRAKQDVKWYRPCYDFLISKAISINVNKKDVIENLNAANGIIEEEQYRYVTKPMKIKDETIAKLPGTIREFDFLTPIKEKNLGEYAELPYNYHVVTTNVDLVMKANKELNEALTGIVQQEFMNKVMGNQDPNQRPNPQQLSQQLESFQKEFLDDWFRERAIKDREKLEYLNRITNFDYQRIQAYYYWWACEEFYTRRYIDKGRFVREILDPCNVFPLDNGEAFIEDMDGIIYVNYLTKQQVIDKWRDKLEPDDWTFLNKIFNQNTTDGTLIASRKDLQEIPMAKYHTVIEAFAKDNWTFTLNGKIPEWTVQWKTEQKIRILIYQNSLGEIKETEVDEDYKLDKANGDIEIKDDWINTVITGTRLGHNSGIAVDLPPEVEIVQRRDKNNKSVCKLTFGGKRGLLTGIRQNPIPRRIIPYMVLYRIYTLQQERAVARYRGDIALVPQSMINNDVSGTTAEKYFYMKADGTLIYDDSVVEAQSAQAFRIVGNPGLDNYLSTLNELRKQTKEEAWDLANMNDYRYGNIPADSTVTNSQQNIINAKLGSVLAITMFNSAMERDHVADMEFSKIAWIDGVNDYYMNKDNDLVHVEIDGSEHCETEYGIFIKNAISENRKLKLAEDIAFSASQNGDFGLALKSIMTDDINKLSKYIDEGAKAKQEFEASQKQEEAKNAQAAQKAEIEDKQKDRDLNIELAHIKEDGANARKQIDVSIAEMNIEGAKGNTEKVATINADVKKVIAEMQDKTKQTDIAAKERIAKSKPATTIKK
jgi:hypothetical protein